MQKNVTWKKLLLYVCICLIVVSACYAQLENGLNNLLCAASSHAVLQIPKARTERSDMLDKDEWLANDDDAQINTHDKKILLVCRDAFPVSLLFQALLSHFMVLLAYASAHVYHRSSCPTRGLLRILSFIQNKDGQKDNISFLFAM